MALSQRETPRAEPPSPDSQDRVGRLRERFLRGRREVCIERARYLTESHRQSEGQPAVLRRARASTPKASPAVSWQTCPTSPSATATPSPSLRTTNRS